jgi:hypothetical protein
MNNRENEKNMSTCTALVTPPQTEAPADAASSSERALNDAILGADIGHSYEEFLAIVDEFYSDGVEVRSAASSEPIIGQTHVKSALLRHLIPLHVMAEIGGLSVRVEAMPVAGDSRDERHSQWSVELIGVTGRRVRMSWTVRRRWQQRRVVAEYHYDHHHEGEPLSLSDLRIATPNGLE